MTTEYDALAASYDAQLAAYEADLDFYVELAKEVGPVLKESPEPLVLELAMGTGRISLPIARAGVPIVGLDSSVEMIATHRSKLGRVVSFDDTFTSPESGNEVEIWEYRTYRPHDQFIDQRFVYHEWDKDGTLLRTVRRGYTLCYIWPREFEHLLARSGFEVEALYGWFDRRSFDDKSQEQAWIAQKA